MVLRFPFKSLEPVTYQDMLLCPDCLVLYQLWNAKYSPHKGRRTVLYPAGKRQA